jgi:5-methylcytosine-specific restriction endonuclease McrA
MVELKVMKVCKVCKLSKVISAFPNGYKTKTGYGPYCKICNNEKRRKWREDNRERDNAKTLAYQSLRKEEAMKWKNKYKRENIEKVRHLSKLYRIRFPEKHTQAEAKRRALKKSCLVAEEKEQILRLYSLAQSESVVVCFYCESEIEQNKRHVDHKIPLSRGGSHSVENLVISCASCNLRKGRKTHEEFLFGGAS